ncbi:MAG: amidohydrolase 2 [Acidobacteria bacterium]|nr:amidohydrolase 2 [Acidobacteriota bacterium]
MRYRWTRGLVMLAVVGTAAVASVRRADSAAQLPAIVSTVPYIDTHAHLEPHPLDASVAAARRAMAAQNARMLIFLPPPERPTADPFDSEPLRDALQDSPKAFAFLGGGGTLNAMIEDAVRTGVSGPEVQRRFRERAEEILRQGAIGFGEMTAEHFAGGTPYQYAPPDHPLFLLLSDIAARHRVVIDVHMEAVPQPMALPADLPSPPNPGELHDNIAAFERLLRHNRAARIVWAHLGSDNTGERTAALSRRLLEAHPNLFLEYKLDPLSPGKTALVDADSRLTPGWMQLLRDFPDRFVIGSDQHYPAPANGAQRWERAVELLNRLPDDLRAKVATENAIRIYRLRRS